MNPMNELKLEHEGIKLSLEILSRIVPKIHKTEETGAVEDMGRLIEFFTVFVDTCHHGKEEELLFPALEDIGVSKQGGPIGVMLSEHETGRGCVRALRSALSSYKEGNASAISEIEKHSGAYIKLLHGHIEKENQVLFRIAEEHLPRDVKRSLTEGFERIERDRVGQGKHEMFHQMLEELKKKYSGE